MSGTGRHEPDGKVALLRSAAALGVSAEDLGTFVALVTDHPWSLAMSACRDVDELVRAWPALAATGSSHNLTDGHRDPDRSVLVVRRRRIGGGYPDELEDRFVLGLLRGFIQRGPGLGVLGATAEIGPDCRTWRVSLGPSNLVAHTGARWGAVGPVSGAVLSVLDSSDRVDVDGVSAALAMSSRTLQRRLAEEGTTFRDIRQRARLAAAARAVTMGATLTDAAHEAGFADSAHLSREFRRLVGVQPAQGWFGILVSTCAILGALAPIHGETIGIFEILEVAGYLLWPLWMIAAGITLAVRAPTTHPAKAAETLPA